MNCRGLYVFKHVGDGKDTNQAKLGVAPAHKLFNLISVSKKTIQRLQEIFPIIRSKSRNRIYQPEWN
ncbi:hypothetical protein LEP1GSC124_1608 [Leptospira interrogans serovar Pyrogenes str. 200701872]|uniref:Uncharacterized protein n=1 Tax=Leptospira interrogans serovar Pyrogenes str. 200701872 TaxID=1193029 RepID=M6ZR75_LEPIR|nr:hypothetical protein LEP1GSC124_1608 [Leptospira interrogans serovar Pyrogenes str. 200701872]